MAHINRASFGLLSRVLFLFFQAATTAHQFVPKQLFSILLENKQLFWVASVVAWGKSRKVSASVLEMKINRLHFSVLFLCSPAPPQCFPFSGPDPANVAPQPIKISGADGSHRLLEAKPRDGINMELLCPCLMANTAGFDPISSLRFTCCKVCLS